MPSLTQIATSLWFIVGLLIAWPLLFLIQIPFYLAHRFLNHDPRRVWLGNIFRFFNALALWSNPFIRIKTKHSHRVPKKTQKVIVTSNHQSNLDPFVLSASLLPLETKYVGKGSLFSIPIGGWAMRLAGDIPIHFVSKSLNDMTTVKGSSRKCLETMKSTLINNCGLAVFPEGKRNPAPEEGFSEFKIGAFLMAKETKSDILPVALAGTHKIWGVKDTLLNQGKVGVVFGELIKEADYKDATALMEATKKEMERLYEEAKNVALYA